MNKWIIKQSIEFQDWFSKLDDVLQESIVEHVKLLEVFGPSLKRPYADTLKGSQLVNLKELRFNCRDKVIRIFYIFDSDRNAVLLIGGDKAGSGDKKFYLKMINKSEKIYFKYLNSKSSIK